MTADNEKPTHNFRLFTGELQDGKSTFPCREVVVLEMDGTLFVEFTNVGESALHSAVCFSIENGNVQAILARRGGDIDAVYELENDGSWKFIPSQETQPTNEGT